MCLLLSEIHFWTTQEDVVTKQSFYGAFKYHTKKEALDSSSKKTYSERRGILWNPINRRRHKLKDRLRELEDNLIQSKLIHYQWKDNNLSILLSTGLIVFIKVHEETGDILNISFDKQLSTKLQVNIICDGMILGSQVVCICNDGHVLGHGGSWKDGWLLEGGPRRRIHSNGEWLVVWGRPGSEHPQPWSPLTKDYQRANLHLYWLGLRGPELLAYKNTDGEPFMIIVSKVFKQTLILVEQKVTQRGAVSVEVSSLELTGNNLKTIAITAVPLQTQVSCCELSSNEDYLLICCIDSTLAILDRNKGSTKTIKASFIPTLCAWQNLGALAVICNDKGQIQYYDVALNCVKSQIIGEEESALTSLDLTGYFHSQVSVVSLNWDNNHLLVALEQGPIVCITHIHKSLSFISLAKRYIYMNDVKKSIALLLSWEFGEESFFILQKIVAFLLKKPMTEEVAQQLQDALGCYHASPVPLSAEIRNQFGNQIFSLTRRYFHQLVRAAMYETAFLLAVDVVHHDLFMDLHYIAVKIGETEMAAAARAQASALVSRCSSEASNCSHSSCSECSASCGNDVKKKPINIEPANPPNGQDNLEQCTKFNQPETSKTYLPPTGPYDFPKLVHPRANYVKPPQVPFNFTKPTSSNVPPLPFNLSLPNLFNNNLGIPVISSLDSQNAYSTFCPTNPQKQVEQKHIMNSSMRTYLQQSLGNIAAGSNTKFKIVDNVSKNVCEINTDLKLNQTGNGQIGYGRYGTPSNIINSTSFGVRTYPANLLDREVGLMQNIKTKIVEFPKEPPSAVLPQNQRSYVLPKPIIPPPLPVANSTNNLTYTQSATPYVFTRSDALSTSFSPTSPLLAAKKPQSKVKFSDTVTAFIVPEVKRPVRPAPPPHYTDPQKELADSLPLCHPNEDYLKDFAPVRSNENDSPSRDPPKIKVVHFGVV